MEICVDNIQSAINAECAGASRIELCSALSEGGLTPSIGIFKVIKKFMSIPVFVMLRPRTGDFMYSFEELNAMTEDAITFKAFGADGFVFGILDKDKEIDIRANKRLLEVIKPLPATFHRAFDELEDPISSLRTLNNLGFERILTSGQKSCALDGVQLIKELVEQVFVENQKIIVMAGCGINEDNVHEILIKTKVKEIHGSFRTTVKQQSQRNKHSLRRAEFRFVNELLIADPYIMSKVIDILNNYKNTEN